MHLLLPAVTGDTVFTIADYWPTLILGAFIPIVTDLLTRRFTTGWPKTLVLLALSAATAAVQDVQARGDAFTWPQLLASFMLALGTAFTTHNTVWKPTRVTGDDGVVQRVTGGFGIPGPRKSPELVGPSEAVLEGSDPVDRVYLNRAGGGVRVVAPVKLPDGYVPPSAGLMPTVEATDAAYQHPATDPTDTHRRNGA